MTKKSIEFVIINNNEIPYNNIAEDMPPNVKYLIDDSKDSLL